MKIGDIVRWALKNGTPIGAYVKVVGFRRNREITIGQLCKQNMVLDEALQIRYDSNRLEVATIKRIPIAHPIWERIRTGQQIAIIHDPTSAWEDMFKNRPELVEIRDAIYTQKRMTFVVDGVQECWYRRTRQIRLTLGTRIV
jgi:hypothetical protein